MASLRDFENHWGGSSTGPKFEAHGSLEKSNKDRNNSRERIFKTTSQIRFNLGEEFLAGGDKTKGFSGF